MVGRLLVIVYFSKKPHNLDLIVIVEEEFRARLVELEQDMVLLREENMKLKSGGKNMILILEYLIHRIICKYQFRLKSRMYLYYLLIRKEREINEGFEI